MTFHKATNPELLHYMNTMFLYSHFNVVKHLHYPHLHNVFLTVTDSSYYKLYNIPSDMYTIKFQKNYDFGKDLVIKNRDRFSTFDIKKTIFLDVYNETNELLGYYKQDISVEYVSANDFRI